MGVRLGLVHAQGDGLGLLRDTNVTQPRNWGNTRTAGRGEANFRFKNSQKKSKKKLRISR